MIQDSQRLRDFEAHYARTHALPYGEALAVFEALWAEAVALNPDFPGDWRLDVEPDLVLARVLNGLSPTP